MRPPRHLVIMVKEPQAGRVKSRLAREVGAVAATAFYRHAVRALIARLSRDTRWNTVLAVAPDAAVASRAWARSPARIGQGRGDLGARMQRAIDRMPPGPAVLVGSDIPAIRPQHVARAFRALGSADAVFGRAPDGGYWLTGFKRVPRTPRAYRKVRWSTADAFTDTAANLSAFRIALADTLSDVDDRAAHESCRRWAGRFVPPSP